MDTGGIDRVLAHLRAAAALGPGARPDETPGPQSGGFGQALKAALDQVNARQQEAARLALSFERGEPGTELYQVMVASQKANIALQAAIQVRNRLVSAYQDVMNMQI